MRIVFIIFSSFVTISSIAQEQAANDSAFRLKEVTVNAFYSRREWVTIPAGIATIKQAELSALSPVTLLPAFNAIPGIRMEERSPASYRLSLRGSLLRSPFGVRNVKIYWNGFPLTDGGGNTYLNLVDISQLSGVDILKGPVASVYGAGTGGAVLLHSALPFTATRAHQFNAGLSGGSYGLFQQTAGWQYSDSSWVSSLQQVHLQSDGYRQQSAMRKDAVQWNSSLRLGHHQQLDFLAFYTNLYYQTPGGITAAQMQQNPTMARQPAGALPGAVQQKTAVYNSSFYGGVRHTLEIGSHWDMHSFAAGSITRFKNPFITNYEKRAEENISAGLRFAYHSRGPKNSFQWISGAEWLYNHSDIRDFGNRSGQPDTVQFTDNVHTAQWFVFSQAEYTIGQRWLITAGLSLNEQSFRYQRVSDPLAQEQQRNTDGVMAPRLALSYRFNPDIAFYALAAKGFSPPTLAEIRPSDGNYYGDLRPEYGWNYEAGVKGFLLNNRLQFNLAAYYFRLQDAIVRRNNTAGAEYFVNAGKTMQKGWEFWTKYRLLMSENQLIRTLDAWSSFCYQPYRFTDYRQGNTDYSGSHLTGVPRTVWVSGLELESHAGYYVHLSLNATSSLPLTDANDATADAYQLLQFKMGYQWRFSTTTVHLFAGMDNALNRLYSLGNDINAAGKRYYNPAPGRNFFAGVNFYFK